MDENAAARSQAAGPTAKPRRRLVQKLGDRIDAGVRGFGETIEALVSIRQNRLLHEFADVVAAAREPKVVESALVRLAGELTGGCRVELMLDRDDTPGSDPRLIACWPLEALDMTDEEIDALGSPLCLGLWCGDHYQMSLRLYASPGKGGKPWSPRVVRRLTTLCAVAAAAERGLHAGRRARIEASSEGSAVIRDATFLNAILPYALAQAQRHRELLSVFCVEIENSRELYQSKGTESACAAVQRVAKAVAGTLRGSDVIVRLDDDRVIVVLPNTGGPNALEVAEIVRTALTAACQPSADLPELSVSLGVACFPENGRDMFTLLEAADQAAGRARAQGRNQIATASISTPESVVAS
jgi:diguanylate cyclase (GGDEF)-like protein